MRTVHTKTAPESALVRGDGRDAASLAALARSSSR